MEYKKDELNGHGFHAITITILDEVLGFRVELTEQKLAHKVLDMYCRAHNRTKHLPVRTQIIQ